MQRWILWAALAVVGLALIGGGGLYGYREFSQGKPANIWVPIPLNLETPLDEQENIASKIDTELRKDEILKKVISDLGLVGKFGVSGEDAALVELKKRLFVEVGLTETHVGPMPSINVGMKGTRREAELSTEMTERVAKDVFRMIGIDPETGRPFGQ
ncbi:hypothetical protein [Luteolibacter sp. AS25]|uniref:hypothetical protein n=1 Tax=Luteolibacter sp. AS25 TaxID=3135776 RepID=UPI00398AEF3C